MHRTRTLARVVCRSRSLAAGAGSRYCAQEATPAYKNEALPFDARVKDLVGRMTLEEKVSQMKDVAPAIPRLGVPEYNWWNEALHGVARSGLATVFPQAIGLAATWDDSLMFRMATVISDEARAKHHEYLRNNSHQRYQGLTVLVAEHQPLPRSALGPRAGDVRRRSVSHRQLGVQFIRGLAGRRSRSTSRPSRP